MELGHIISTSEQENFEVISPQEESSEEHWQSYRFSPRFSYSMMQTFDYGSSLSNASNPL